MTDNGKPGAVLDPSWIADLIEHQINKGIITDGTHAEQVAILRGMAAAAHPPAQSSAPICKTIEDPGDQTALIWMQRTAESLGVAKADDGLFYLARGLTSWIDQQRDMAQTNNVARNAREEAVVSAARKIINKAWTKGAQNVDFESMKTLSVAIDILDCAAKPSTRKPS